MKILLKIIIGFLAVVGALTIAAGTYLYIADPFGLKTLFMAPDLNTTNINAKQTDIKNSTNPLITPNQAAALQKLGIDPSKLPTEISPAKEACFVASLGQARVNEIKAGAVPTPMDLLKAKSCL
jgi:hypothetical protein